MRGGCVEERGRHAGEERDPTDASTRARITRECVYTKEYILTKSHVINKRLLNAHIHSCVCVCVCEMHKQSKRKGDTSKVRMHTFDTLAMSSTSY